MFSEHLGLQPEVLYSIQGYKNGSSTYKAGYITVPVLVRFNVNDVLSFHVGPQVGILASAKYDSNDVKDDVKSTDVGAAIGAAVDLPMGLNFNLRFYKGFTDINDSGTSPLTVKNFNLQVSVGYKLFGKK